MPDPTTKPVRAWCAVTPRGRIINATNATTQSKCWHNFAFELGISPLIDPCPFDRLREDGYRVVRVRVEVEVEE